MAVARDRWRARHRTGSARTPVVVGSRLTHSSMRVGCRLLDLPFVAVDTTDRGTVDVAALRAAVRTHRGRIVAIVANAGTTTAGAIDPLEDLAEVCNESGTWMHVDAAYGGGILFSSKYSNRVSGIAQADSFVVDPHKWLFCPYDSSLLMYRNAREVHEELKVFQQSHEDAAVYLDFGERHTPDDDTPLQLPNEVGDLALGLSRRPRGVALWALLAAFGPDWIGQQVEAAVDAIASLGDYARSRGVAVPIDPQLSVLLLAKEAWPHARDWDEHWVRPAFDKGFFVSTDEYKGSPVGRLCLINPTVTAAQLEPLIDLIANQT
jgi:glutamate/tyrosine decarboxylase-like PLP-dependent enzyme